MNNKTIIEYEELCFLPYKLIFLCLVELNWGRGGGGRHRCSTSTNVKARQENRPLLSI